jgi:hypothetical protein
MNRTPGGNYRAVESGGGSGSGGAQPHQEADSALLLLIHGPFIFGAVTLYTLPLLMFITKHALDNGGRELAIGMCIGALLFLVWTLYAIYQTLKKNIRNPTPAFGSFGFISLMLLTVMVGVFDLWLLILIVVDN